MLVDNPRSLETAMIAFEVNDMTCGHCVSTITKAVKDADKDAKVRCEAVLALLKFGPDAREVIPALTDVRQHDRDRQVRAYAAKAWRLRMPAWASSSSVSSSQSSPPGIRLMT